MEEYIKGNKEAWEEAFRMRDEKWCADITEQLKKGDYVYFMPDLAAVLKKYSLDGKCIGQFCCNNGRELLSLVKTANAKEGIGFDIAENVVRFANEKASESEIPCKFVATNILEIGEEYKEHFDMVIITIGALCWFKNLSEYFAIVSKCMKPGGTIVINDSHPFTNMIFSPGEEGFDQERPFNCNFSYFNHEWIGNDGMYYITGKSYKSKTFTDYTHSISDIIGSMCTNHLVVTNMQEFDYDISGGFSGLDHKEFPLSMIIEATKL